MVMTMRFLGHSKAASEPTHDAFGHSGAKGFVTEAKILNRVIRWTDAGLEYEADPRQLEKLLRDFGLDDGVKAVSAPGVKMTAADVADDKPLSEDKHTAFRAVAARCNYLAADRLDCQYAAKEICRWMSSPTEGSMAALKKLGRYLVRAKRVVNCYDR